MITKRLGSTVGLLGIVLLAGCSEGPTSPSLNGVQSGPAGQLLEGGTSGPSFNYTNPPAELIELGGRISAAEAEYYAHNVPGIVANAQAYIDAGGGPCTYYAAGAVAAGIFFVAEVAEFYAYLGTPWTWPLALLKGMKALASGGTLTIALLAYIDCRDANPGGAVPLPPRY